MFAAPCFHIDIRPEGLHRPASEERQQAIAAAGRNRAADPGNRGTLKKFCSRARDPDLGADLARLNRAIFGTLQPDVRSYNDQLRTI